MDPLRDLDVRGFTRIEGILSPERRQRLADRLEALFAEEGEAAGSEFRRWSRDGPATSWS